MNKKLLHRIIGFSVFLMAAFTYFLTVQPSVSFWDCGEFIASSYLMQVPHPPGTPLFLILGRLFAMIPFAENIALRVNAVSVISSAFTVLFVYLIIVKLIENFRKNEDESILESLGTYIAAAIGALSLAFSDTFWFNAVEAEVYALATFFIGIVVWLIMVWNEKADEPDSEKYLLLIAYLIGLSTGVHLMAVLAIVPIVMVIMFRKYLSDETILKKTITIFLIHAGIVLLILVGLWSTQTQSSPPGNDLYKAFDMRALMIVAVASIIFMAVMWKKIFQKNSFYLPIIFGGIVLVATYPGIVKYFPNMVSTIGKNNIVFDVLIIIAFFAGLGYLIYWSKKNDRMTLNLVLKSLLFALIGFSSYAMIIIRSNQDTPINLNSPKTFSELVSYLNREQYGEFPTLQRRYSQEPHQVGIYKEYTSDLDFLVRYQMNHMFNRYLLWNYVGRNSTVQDSGVDWTEFFGIPFFIGLFGIYYLFKRDWKMAAVFLTMFIFLGWLTAFYQNQQQPQPRERDYFYTGAFFVFSIWIGLGVKGLLDLTKQQFSKSSLLNPALSFIMVVAFVIVPVNMLKGNYFSHDRSRNYVPWDYSYNLLQSVATNAVIFTNGDNDTFPLWYLQDVEGVRRDVRIANLSLLNTDWYIKQLKNTAPHGAAKVKMSISDEEIATIGPSRWETREMKLEVPESVFEEFGVTDTAVINSGSISWSMPFTMQFGNVKAVRTQDIAALDIIKTNNWERPIYFAATTSEQSQLGLDDYLQMEGLAFRLVPKKVGSTYNVNEEILSKQLFNEPEGFSKDYQPGFKFRGLNDPTVYMDDNHQRLSRNYRFSFLRLAYFYAFEKKDKAKTLALLDTMEAKLPRRLIPIEYPLLNDIAGLYKSSGDYEKYIQLIREVEKEALEEIAENPKNFTSRYNPYIILLGIYEDLKEFEKAIDLLSGLQKFMPDDQSVQQRIDTYRRMIKQDSTEVNKPAL
ncbi:MAG: DUF2723 domain-containing protein [Bacteroidetes bacterium]|nr:DUF2723 domain-containing protein [Bacteroidota bacterium]